MPPGSSRDQSSAATKPGLGSVKVVLDLDGEEYLLAFQSFHTVDPIQDAPIPPSRLCRSVRDAFGEAVAKVRGNVDLWGFEGLIMEVQGRVERKNDDA